VKILPISDKFNAYAYEVEKSLKAKDIRTEVDDRSEKIGKKIRDTELAKVPYMLIVGEKEVNEKTVSVRRHGKGDLGSKLLVEFIGEIEKEVEEMN
jgi:threonyl-tRNA synthetase